MRSAKTPWGMYYWQRICPGRLQQLKALLSNSPAMLARLTC